MNQTKEEWLKKLSCGCRENERCFHATEKDLNILLQEAEQRVAKEWKEKLARSERMAKQYCRAIEYALDGVKIEEAKEQAEKDFPLLD